MTSIWEKAFHLYLHTIYLKVRLPVQDTTIFSLTEWLPSTTEVKGLNPGLNIWLHTVYMWSVHQHSAGSCGFFMDSVIFYPIEQLTACVRIKRSVLFLSDKGPMLETLDYTICIGSTLTFLYFERNVSQLITTDFTTS